MEGKGCVAPRTEKPTRLSQRNLDAFGGYDASWLEHPPACLARSVDELFVAEVRPQAADAGLSNGVWQRRVAALTAHGDSRPYGVEDEHLVLFDIRIGLEWIHLFAELNVCGLANIALFSDSQRAFVDSVRNSMPDKVTELETSTAEMFERRKALELDRAATLAVRFAARGIVVAQAHGFDAPEVDDARLGLLRLRRTIGDNRTLDLLTKVPDPEDPAGRRTLAPRIDHLTRVPQRNK